MKKAAFLLGFFCFSSLFAQSSETKTTVQNNQTVYPDYSILQTKMSMKDVVTKADTIPEFPGGPKAFKRKYFESIETLDVKVKEKVDTRLYFIVEKNGSVKNIAAIGSNKKHAEAAELGLRRIFARWKPATINGEPVRYLMYFPLTSKRF